jgi:PAS domain S-box-containing protein
MSSTLQPNPESATGEVLPAAIIASTDDAIIGKDLAGIIRSWNQGATRLFGYHPVEIIGQPIRLLIPPELFGQESEILASILRGEPVKPFETIRLRKNGTLVEVSVTISPIHDETGRVTGALKLARDVTRTG